MNGQRLKELRQKHNHTQGSLADLMNTNARQIWRWESGENTPDSDSLAMLAKVLEVSADYLLGLTDEPSRSAGLSDDEIQVIRAMRRGDGMEAIRVIAAGAKVRG